MTPGPSKKGSASESPTSNLDMTKGAARNALAGFVGVHVGAAIVWFSVFILSARDMPETRSYMPWVIAFWATAIGYLGGLFLYLLLARFRPKYAGFVVGLLFPIVVVVGAYAVLNRI